MLWRNVLLISGLVISIISTSWAGSVEDFNAGRQSYFKGDHDKAIELFTKVINDKNLSKKNLANAYLWRGMVMMIMGEYESALRDMDKGINLNPNDPIAYYNRGSTHRKFGHYKVAISDYSKCIEFAPKKHGAFSLRGTCYEKLGQIEKALGDYNTAIELSPDSPAPYYHRAKVFAGKGLLQKAYNDAQKALRLKPQNKRFQELFNEIKAKVDTN